MPDDMRSEREEIQPAQTRYQTLRRGTLPVAQGEFASLRWAEVALQPLTGRRHQLRRHLKHIAHPIMGDATHGKGPLNRAVAAHLGLPYAFASHFAPDALDDALRIYRERFQPSAQLDRPHAMVGVNIVAADTDAEARRLFTSIQQRFTDMLRNQRGQLAPPIDDIDHYWTPAERAQASRMLACSFVGSPATLRESLQRFVDRTGADELMVNAAIYDHDARVRSYELLAGVAAEIEPRQPAELALSA
jgi:alkanesulfonate monooxygenase SsuD/methylene tetrahydromethanopterin reductase-like flavin-dependent oxidoreductase (luciferase family)